MAGRDKVAWERLYFEFVILQTSVNTNNFCFFFNFPKIQKKNHSNRNFTLQIFLKKEILSAD